MRDAFLDTLKKDEIMTLAYCKVQNLFVEIQGTR